MNLERISDALQTYTGREESMHQVVSVLEEELGENWTQTVFQDLQSLPPALKRNLTNVFNYYAATVAWNETQTYLADPELEYTPEIEERLPILRHWLEFFGDPGVEVYKKLEDRLAEIAAQEKDNTSQPTEEVATESKPESDIESEIEKTDEVTPSDEEIPSEEIQETQEVTESEDVENQVEESPEADTDLPVDGAELDLEETKDEIEENPEEEESEEPEKEEVAEEFADNPMYFEIQKLSNQVALLEQNRAWLAARCIQLKDIEVYAYPFYGFIVDLMRQILKSMENILSNEDAVSLIDIAFDGGREAFDHKKEAIEHDIELAEQNCESATTALISDDMDMDEVKRTLGTIDDSDTVEYMGPAPDGFELLDDETPLDETAIKKQYEKLENMDALTGNKGKAEEENVDKEKENASQNEQKGVQRKLSFSLKKKKPSGDES